MSRISVFFLLFFLTKTLFAQLNPPFIADTYYQGVVKILLYDPVLEQQFKLKTGEGYLGRGSGFIVTENGLVFTNRHVIEQCVFGYGVLDYTNAEGKKMQKDIVTYKSGMENDPAVSAVYYTGHAVPLVQVYTGKGPEDYKLYIARVLSLSESFDGAILKIVSDIDGKPVKMPFKPVPIGDAETARQGQRICVFGYPAQYEGGLAIAAKDMSTMTIGYHSGWDYVFNNDYGFIKTDASINGGNSGGPAFGESNKVIGIASAKGLKTNIGLVGGINAMYYVAAPSADLLKTLVTKGLKKPAKAGKITTISGEIQALPAPEDWQVNQSRKTYQKTASGTVTVSGSVKSVDSGKSIADASISLLLPKVENPKTAEDYQVIATAKSDREGGFSLTPRVKPGAYVFVAILEGYQSVVSQVEISASNDEFNVKLSRER